MDLKELQERLGYGFDDFFLLETALTHSSWTNEHDPSASHNERLEYLGDAVLELTVSEQLFARFPMAREGDLTRLRSGLVNERVLAGLARDLRLDRLLRLGKGEESQGGRQRDALLADAFEAVLGAVFLDGGFDAGRAVVARNFSSRWPRGAEKARRKDFKTRLQELTQRVSRGLPSYVLEESRGPEHAKIFAVHVNLPDGRVFRAEGISVKRAEQEAARLALEASEAPAAPEMPGETDALTRRP